jgi:hypothetical protein
MLTKVIVHVESYTKDGQLIYTDNHMSVDLGQVSGKDYLEILDLTIYRNAQQLIHNTVEEHLAKEHNKRLAETNPKPKETVNAPENPQSLSAVPAAAGSQPVPAPGAAVPGVPAGSPPVLDVQVIPPDAGTRQG